MCALPQTTVLVAASCPLSVLLLPPLERRGVSVRMVGVCLPLRRAGSTFTDLERDWRKTGWWYSKVTGVTECWSGHTLTVLEDETPWGIQVLDPMWPCLSRLLSDVGGAPFRGPRTWCLDLMTWELCVNLPDWLSPCFSRKGGLGPDASLDVFHCVSRGWVRSMMS